MDRYNIYIILYRNHPSSVVHAVINEHVQVHVNTPTYPPTHGPRSVCRPFIYLFSLSRTVVFTFTKRPRNLIFKTFYISVSRALLNILLFVSLSTRAAQLMIWIFSFTKAKHFTLSSYCIQAFFFIVNSKSCLKKRYRYTMY